MFTDAGRLILVAALIALTVGPTLAQEQGKGATESPLTVASEKEGFASLNDKRKRVEAVIPELGEELFKLKSDLSFLRDFESRNARDAEELKRAQAERDNRRISFIKRRMEDFTDEMNQRGLEGKKAKDLEPLIREKEIAFSTRKQELSQIEATIDRRLNVELAKQQFKTDMSRTFAALVGFLMAGFFVIAWKDENVRRAVFSGQAGIQLLTLFSLVIAIILFGITEVLEDKELSALLGGLSGYILGRVTQPRGGAQDQVLSQQGTANQARPQQGVVPPVSPQQGAV